MKKIFTLESVRGKRTFVRRALANNRRTKNTFPFDVNCLVILYGGSLSVTAISNKFLEFL